MQTDYNAVLQWIYLFNSIALIQLALRQLRKRRKGRELDRKIKTAAVGQWAGTAPEALVRQLGAPGSQGDFDHGQSASAWRGERQVLEAFYRDGKCTGIEVRSHADDAFPNLNTYFNCAVLAALACAWKLTTAANGMPEGGETLPVAAAAKQYLANFVLFFAGAWLASFVLKRRRLLLNGGCIVMLVLSLPLPGWP